MESSEGIGINRKKGDREEVSYNISGSTAIVEFESDVLGKLSFIEKDLGTRTTAYGLPADFINAVTG